jgi:hypothetical protein
LLRAPHALSREFDRAADDHATAASQPQTTQKLRSRSKRTGGSIGSDRYRNRERTDISPMPHLASLVSARVPKRYAHGDVSVSSFILHVCRPVSAPSPLPFEIALMGARWMVSARFDLHAVRRLAGYEVSRSVQLAAQLWSDVEDRSRPSAVAGRLSYPFYDTVARSAESFARQPTKSRLMPGS